MKHLLLFFFVSATMLSQTDSIIPQNISVISTESINIVYRGVDNRIKIAVSGAASISASAPGIRKGTGEENYILVPGAGKDVTVYVAAKMANGETKVEKKKFRILDLPTPDGGIEGHPHQYEPIKMSKKEFIASTITVNWEDFFFDVKIKVWKFSLKNIHKRKIVTIAGNTMNEEAVEFITQQRKGSILLISDIKYTDASVGFPREPGNFLIELTD